MMKSVLLVDDARTILLSVGDIFKKENFKVETASNGKEALALLNQGLKPDLIISDVNMPVMNGIEFVREARSLLRFTPILMLTTESQQKMRDEGKQAGATGWLVKPVDAVQLMQIVKRVVPGA